MPMKSSYHPLGCSLGLNTDELKAIQEKKSSDDEALEDVLRSWLQRDKKMFGPCTWKMLVKAIDKLSGESNCELAKRIASNHPGELYLLNFIHCWSS